MNFQLFTMFIVGGLDCSDVEWEWMTFIWFSSKLHLSAPSAELLKRWKGTKLRWLETGQMTFSRQQLPLWDSLLLLGPLTLWESAVIIFAWRRNVRLICVDDACTSDMRRYTWCLLTITVVGLLIPLITKTSHGSSPMSTTRLCWSISVRSLQRGLALLMEPPTDHKVEMCNSLPRP